MTNRKEEIAGYGVRLERLSKHTIELLRNWRNQDHVRCQMEFQKVISKEQQIAWFETIHDNPKFVYYIVFVGQTPIGMIHLSELDQKKGTGHVGLFIGAPQYMGTGTALGASLLILDLAFDQLKLKTLFAKVKNTNEAVIHYNKVLGFKYKQAINEGFDLFDLTSEEFFRRKAYLEKLIRIASKVEK